METPTVFLEPQSTAAFLEQQLMPLIQSGELTPTQLASIVQQLTTHLTGVPIGTVAPDQSDSSDILLAFRNFGELDVWGADLAADVFLTDRIWLRGAFSYVSEDCFDFDDDQDCSSAVDLALNAPRTKGSFGIGYEDAKTDFSAGISVRSTRSFPMNSGVYVGKVDGYTVFDGNLAFRLPWVQGAVLSLTSTNLFDEKHQEFVGAPELGRLLLLRLSFDLPYEEGAARPSANRPPGVRY